MTHQHEHSPHFTPNTILDESLETVNKKPSLYNVIMLNDDYTPMDFVTKILQTIFHFNEFDSQQIMMTIHTEGQGHCGTFSFDVANTKILQVKEIAKKEGHPLQCKLTPENDKEDS